MPKPSQTPKEEEPQPNEQPNEEAWPKSRSRKARRISSERKAQEARDQEERDRARNEFWNQAYTGLKSRNDWTPTEEAESPTKAPAEPSQSQEVRRLDLEQQTPNPMGIATPFNAGLAERFCREEAFHEEGEVQETAPPQEAASSSREPNPDPQIPQETLVGKHRRKGDKLDSKEEMETEPEGRDLAKEAEEEATAAAAAINAASCAAVANEAARIAAEEANKSVAAAQQIANEATRAVEIPTPATPNPTQASAASEYPDPARNLRELLPCPPGTVPPRGLTPLEVLEARGETLPDSIHPAWIEWKNRETSTRDFKSRQQS